jgi:predicted P-loop ATPase
MDKITKSEVLKVIQYLARKNEKSPFLEYIDKLVWDGQPRLETWMIRHWGLTDDTFTREVSKKWLIAAYARMAKPGTKIDWMPIVIGPQGTGKTTMPGILFGKENYLPIYGESSDKDLLLLQHSHLCVGFDELDSFTKRESSTLKAMITRSEDAFRPPYGAVIETFPRRFTLYGCGNKREFLQHDPSGYRRYAILEVDRILDFAGLESERDLLWAEAKESYHNLRDYRYWEVEGASERAREFVPPNILEEKVLNWISTQFFNKGTTNVKDDVLYFTMTILMGGIGMSESDSHNPMKSKEIAAILNSLGCERGNTRRMVVPGVTGRHYFISRERHDPQR